MAREKTIGVRLAEQEVAALEALQRAFKLEDPSKALRRCLYVAASQLSWESVRLLENLAGLRGERWEQVHDGILNTIRAKGKVSVQAFRAELRRQVRIAIDYAQLDYQIRSMKGELSPLIHPHAVPEPEQLSVEERIAQLKKDAEDSMKEANEPGYAERVRKEIEETYGKPTETE